MKRVQSNLSLRGGQGSDAVAGDDLDSLSDGAELPEGKPSRHLWLGNIPLKPSKAAMEVRPAAGSGGRGGCVLFGLSLGVQHTAETQQGSDGGEASGRVSVVLGLILGVQKGCWSRAGT